jgi:hypothetical protein
LKSIKIPTEFHEHLNIDQSQFNNNQKDNQNNNGDIPSWLQKLLLHDGFVDLENTYENN